MPARKPPLTASFPVSLPNWLPYMLLVAATLLVYSNIYGNEFLLDDEFDIVNNSLLRSWRTLITAFTTSFTAGSGGEDIFYRPLQTLLYLFVYKIFGLAP